MPVYDLAFSPNPNALAWRIPGSMITPAPTYTEVARWNATHSNTSQGADYYSQGSGASILDGSIFVNRTVLSGTIPTAADTTNTYRLRLVLAGNPTPSAVPVGSTLEVIGNITTYTQFAFGGGRDAMIIDSASAMRDVFGDGTNGAVGISNVGTGAYWVLERQTQGPAVTENDYRLVYNPAHSGTPNQAPNLDTARWTALSPTAWANKTGYATIGTYVTNNGLFRSTVVIPAIGAGAGNLTASWNSAVLNVNTNARYIVNFNGIQNYIDASSTEKTGDFPTDTTGTWELYQGSNFTTGSLVVINKLDNNVRFRVGTTGQMETAFGSVNVSSGPDWRLFLNAYAAPNDDILRWQRVNFEEWDGRHHYYTGQVVRDGTTYYQAQADIPAPAGVVPAALNWTRRASVPIGRHIYAYDTDTSAITWRLNAKFARDAASDINFGTLDASADAFHVPPVISNNRIFFLDDQRQPSGFKIAFAFNATTFVRESGSDINVDGNDGTSYTTSIVSGNRIFFLSNSNNTPANNKAFAYNATTFAREASSDIVFGFNFPFDPFVSNNRLFIGESSSHLRAYNSTTYTRVSADDITLPTGFYGGLGSPTPVISNNRIFIMQRTGNFPNNIYTAIAYNATTFARESTNDISFGTTNTASGVVAGTTMFFIQGNNAIAYNATTFARETENDIALGTGNWRHAIVSNNKLFFIDDGLTPTDIPYARAYSF